MGNLQEGMASGLSEMPEEVYSYGWSTGQPTTLQIYPPSDTKGLKKKAKNSWLIKGFLF